MSDGLMDTKHIYSRTRIRTHRPGKRILCSYPGCALIRARFRTKVAHGACKTCALIRFVLLSDVFLSGFACTISAYSRDSNLYVYFASFFQMVSFKKLKETGSGNFFLKLLKIENIKTIV